jgi:CDP-diacylglycerol--glycerol-3-phosphate 3-phosphatidyltransferase
MYLDVRAWSSARPSFTKNWQSIRKAKERDRAAGADDAARFVFNGQRAYCNPAMTTANKITIIRILMIPAFVLMAIYYGESIKRGEPLEWQRFTAIAIFLVAAVSDGLDGYIARRYNQKSALGVILDPIADKGLLLSAIITLSISNWSDVDAQYGQFPTWFPVLVISRDAVIVIGSVVLHLLNGKVEVRPSWTGKVATFLQMAAIAWVMLQLMFLPLIYVVAAAGFFTFISGIIYVMDGFRQLGAHGHSNPS